MRLKVGKIKKAAYISETKIKEPDFYMARSIPLSGCTLRQEDRGFKQLKLL